MSTYVRVIEFDEVRDVLDERVFFVDNANIKKIYKGRMYYM